MSTYYPIGTIIKLTIDPEMLFMISGYLPRQDNGDVHDYFAVPLPMGLVKENQYVIFNRKCIVDVIHQGYCDNECKDVLDGFDQIIKNIKE